MVLKVKCNSLFLKERVGHLSNLPFREEIEDIFKWKLEDIYQNEELWEKDYNEVKKQLNMFDKYRGKINSAENLLGVLKLKDEVERKVDKLFTYARMRRDEDYSLELLKKVGVDLTGPKQIEEALDVFEKLLNEWDGQA